SRDNIRHVVNHHILHHRLEIPHLHQRLSKPAWERMMGILTRIGEKVMEKVIGSSSEAANGRQQRVEEEEKGVEVFGSNVVENEYNGIYFESIAIKDEDPNINDLDTINSKSSVNVDSNDNVNASPDVRSTIEPTPTDVATSSTASSSPTSSSTPTSSSFLSLSQSSSTSLSTSIPLSTLFASLFMVYYVILRIRLWNARMKTNVYVGDGATEMIKMGAKDDRGDYQRRKKEQGRRGRYRVCEDIWGHRLL
ncbi:158_t:CDS:2, partial [Paraglomus occultum]